MIVSMQLTYLLNSLNILIIYMSIRCTQFLLSANDYTFFFPFQISYTLVFVLYYMAYDAQLNVG